MKRALVAAGVALVAGLASTSAAAPTQSVTLHVERFWSNACNCFKLQFSGAVSSGEANEYVAVMQQKCGHTYSTAVAGTSTAAGGSWLAEYNGGTSATYRARWNGHLSEPWTLRPQMTIWPPTRLRRGRYRITVYADPAMQNVSGRQVELQRLAAGTWTRVRRARLAADFKQFAGSYSATFTIRTRGLRMRFFIPESSAAPCYTATASKTFKS